MRQSNLLKISVLSLFTAFLVLPYPVRAGTGVKLVVGQELAVPGGLLSTASSGDDVGFIAFPNRSYCCLVHTASGDNARFSSVEIEGTTTAVSYFPRGMEQPVVVPEEPKSRACFIAPESLTDSDEIALSLQFGESGFPAVASNVRVRCDETTLFCGFNTSVTDFNFLEIQNTLGKTPTGGIEKISGRVIGVDVISGTTKLDQAFEVGRGETSSKRVDVDIHSKTGAGAFGPIVIIHDGPPGSIKAVVSQYNVTSSTPLTFAPVAQEVCTPRK